MDREHFKILDGTADDLTKWHRRNSPLQLDLKSADLSGRDLSGRDFSRAILDGVNFSGSNLDDAVFTEARMRYADFSDASMKRAILYRSNCAGSNLTNTDLSLIHI